VEIIDDDANTLEEDYNFSIENDFVLRFSNKAGCFSCINVFKVSKITEWIDDNTTAICPECGVDSVLPDSMVDICKKHLQKIHDKYFSKKTDKK